ncbi:MAG: 8-amino-7-oxononanoate synthase [Oleibacter sp.]|nr:8-amino-7-oxononanoate synthase [Thalassolituus sp.]
MSWNQRLESALQARREQHLWRQRHTIDSPQGVLVRVEGQSLINFCSNDYLGLASQGGDDLARAAQTWQLGSGASHLVCGHSRAHHELEDALAAHTGYPKALLFSTGYMANLGVISALAQRGDRILQDKLNHASLLDGAQLSRATSTRYRHQDYAHLEQLLEDSAAQGSSNETLVISDSIFSMDGDLADASQLAQLCSASQSSHRQNSNHQKPALLMIDDAHGFGVLGDHGGGVREAFNLTPEQLPVYVGTLGKALGGCGAFVAGSEALIDYLVQFARSYIYTTALPPALADAMLGNLERLKNNALRQQLRQRIAQFRFGANELGLPLMASNSPIQPLLIGSSDTAMVISEELRQRGFWVSAIRPPTVPQGQARLRVTLSAAHSAEQVEALLQALAVIKQAHGL